MPAQFGTNGDRCSRREFLAAAVQPSLAALVAAKAPAAAQSLTAADDEMLEDLSRRCFHYFWEHSDAHTGIARDRARADGGLESRYVGSTGATGFALTALAIGAERGWIPRDKARNRARAALRSYAEGPVENVHGWFYHFVDIRSGARYRASEVSTSDSTWLVLHGHPFFLAHGWTPESGFLPYRYDRYCQLACMYLLGIGSPAHALDPEAWYAWSRDPFHYGEFDYYRPHSAMDLPVSVLLVGFSNRREPRGFQINWFENSATATRAHRAFCLDLAREFPGYSDHIWGITSSDGPGGYQTWGGPPRTGRLDGSVVPCAAAGSLMFTPEICLPALHAMKARFGDRIYKKYGFVDAFNPNTPWQAEDVIGIDAGITLLSAENLRTKNVWKWFMSNPEAQRAFELVGIQRS